MTFAEFQALVDAHRPKDGRRLAVPVYARRSADLLTPVSAYLALREEGAPGELISFDVAEGTGWLVPERLRGHWTLVHELTTSGFERVLGDREIGLLVCDSDPAESTQRFEFGFAVAHAAAPQLLMGCNDHGAAMRETTEAAGATYRPFVERPADHFYRGARLGFARLEP